MRKEDLIRTIQGYEHKDLIKEQYGKHNLSTDEMIMLSDANGISFMKYYQHLTVEEFANKFEGDFLSIYYKNGEQVGFVRTSSNEKISMFPLQTFQNILFDVEHPENGLISFNLNDYRNENQNS